MARRSFEDRFWKKISPEPNSGCWLWMGSATPEGYPRMSLNGGSTYAHRASYEFYVGKIPGSLHLDHLCRVPCCVNPAHLEPVTVKENVGRGLLGTLRTHCKHGHALTEENISLGPNGWRGCRACLRRSRGPAAEKQREYFRQYAEKWRAKNPDHNRQWREKNVKKVRA